MQIQNRRYTGSKYKLMPWIKDILAEECHNCFSFADIFAGTGIVTAQCLDMYKEFIINDFLFSNEIIYRAFFEKGNFSLKKLEKIASSYHELIPSQLPENYVSQNYGDKYFSVDDARKIGFIREDIENLKTSQTITEKEYNILLASLLYSFDRCANTVGHYEAYIKGKTIRSLFNFELIEPYKHNKKIRIFREDANMLARTIHSDIVFIDPPYSSRQYSRFYHVMETITKWNKPELHGVAMKPSEENMSDYCRCKATSAFHDLISHLDCKYIVVTYNNTYNSKSSSSENKIALNDILLILQERGETKRFEHEHQAFNAGKTDLSNHKEYLFITEVHNA